jgi:hypothetical protein
MLATLFRLTGRYAEEVLQSIIWQSILTLLVLTVESVVYWYLRRRFYKMSWVWSHIILMYLILLLLPVLYTLTNFIIPRYFNLDETKEWMGRIYLIRTILFWSGLAIAHFFFVLTIARSFSIKQPLEKGHNEASDFLDEFHG